MKTSPPLMASPQDRAHEPAPAPPHAPCPLRALSLPSSSHVTVTGARRPPSQVAAHRETGQSRGYAFVSYETVEMANTAITNLHNMTVDSRTLRVELARADKEAKPY